MDNPQIAVLAEKVDALKAEVTALRADLKPLGELVTRHDEQLKAAQTRQNWLGVVLAGTFMGMLKNWLHL